VSSGRDIARGQERSTNFENEDQSVRNGIMGDYGMHSGPRSVVAKENRDITGLLCIEIWLIGRFINGKWVS
ncbi:hypothetical protein Tco_0920354, partial [Tanacetum coccineum]